MNNPPPVPATHGKGREATFSTMQCSVNRFKTALKPFDQAVDYVLDIMVSIRLWRSIAERFSFASLLTLDVASYLFTHWALKQTLWWLSAKTALERCNYHRQSPHLLRTHGRLRTRGMDCDTASVWSPVRAPAVYFQHHWSCANTALLEGAGLPQSSMRAGLWALLKAGLYSTKSTAKVSFLKSPLPMYCCLYG